MIFSLIAVYEFRVRNRIILFRHLIIEWQVSDSTPRHTIQAISGTRLSIMSGRRGSFIAQALTRLQWARDL
jgi:hypothetical protein